MPRNSQDRNSHHRNSGDHAAPPRTSTGIHRPPRSLAWAAILLLGLLGYLPLQAAAQTGDSPETQMPAADEPLAVEITDMVITRVGVALTLTSGETQQDLHLMIGSLEGQSIVRAMRHARLPRPQTHDLMKTLLEKDGWQVTRVVIRELSHGTFYADLVMERPGTFGIEGNMEQRTMDARPSDAIALGLRFDAKIYVLQKVFDQERETTGPEQEAPGQPEQEEESAPETLTI